MRQIKRAKPVASNFLNLDIEGGRFVATRGTTKVVKGGDGPNTWPESVERGQTPDKGEEGRRPKRVRPVESGNYDYTYYSNNSFLNVYNECDGNGCVVNSSECENTLNVAKSKIWVEGKRQTKLKIAGLNVRSLKNSIKALHLQKMLALEIHDIVMINETWLEKDFKCINGNYQVFQNNHKSGYKGTMILLKKPVKAYAVKIQSDNGCLIKIITQEGMHLFVMSLYFPPDSQEWKKSHKELKDVVTFLTDRYIKYSLVIYADVNRNLRDDKIRQSFTKFIEECSLPTLRCTIGRNWMHVLTGQ